MSININKVQEFQKWNGIENQNKYLNNENVEDFQMFDYNASTYSKDVKEFAKNYVDAYDKDKDGYLNKDEFMVLANDGEKNADRLEKEHELFETTRDYYQNGFIDGYDKDNDGVLSKDEFLNMFDVDTDSLSETDKKEWNELFAEFNGLKSEDKDHIDAEELAVVSNLETIPNIMDVYNGYQQYNILSEGFEQLNLDENKDTISAEEYATMLMVSDIDVQKFNETDGDLSQSIDGAINYNNYQKYGNMEPGEEKDIIQDLRTALYENYYAQ